MPPPPRAWSSPSCGPSPSVSERGLVGPDPDREFDLVALATVADAVPLVGQNRRLVMRGLAEMRRATRPGIRALCQAAGIDPRTLDARALGYTLAPVINAAGRLRHPDDALALLLEDDLGRACTIADELWALNAERRDVEQAITAEAIAQIEASPPEIRDANAILAIGDGWHEGVVGIVASRLVDHFDRPALVPGTRRRGRQGLRPQPARAGPARPARPGIGAPHPLGWSRGRRRACSCPPTRSPRSAASSLRRRHPWVRCSNARGSDRSTRSSARGNSPSRPRRPSRRWRPTAAATRSRVC